MQNDENNNESRFFVKICPIKGLSGNVWDRGCKAGRYTKEGKISGDFARKGKKGDGSMNNRWKKRMAILASVIMLLSMTSAVEAQTRATTDPLTGYTPSGYYSGNMILYERDLRVWLQTSPYISNEEMWTEIDVYYVIDGKNKYSASRSGANYCSFSSTLCVNEARCFYYVEGDSVGDIWLSIPVYL